MSEIATIARDETQLELVLKSFNYSRSFFSNRYNLFRRWLKLYHQIPENKPYFRANLFIPLVYPLISTVLPRMVANLPKFRLEPREDSDEKSIKIVSDLIDYQLDRSDFFKKLKMWVKDVLLFGTGIIKVYWRRDDQKEYNDPDLELVDLLDFYPDPKATEIDGGDFMIHRSIVPFSFLKEQRGPDGKELYNNLEVLKSSFNTEDKSSRVFVGNDRSMTVDEIDGQLNLSSPYRQSVSKQIEILEYWGVNPDQDDEESVIVVANRNTIIRSEKNPFEGKRPFIKMHIDPIAHDFFGKGLIEPIEHLQLELNDTRNQRMDNVNLILNRMFLVLRSAAVNENELISRPGGVIFTDIPGGVEVLQTPDVTASAYQEEALIKQDAQNAVGVTDIVQGQLRSADESVPGQILNKTATGASLALQQAGSRFKYYLQNIEDALKELGLILYQFNQQFLDQEKVIRVLAPNDFSKLERSNLINKIKGFIGLAPEEISKYQFIKVSPDTLKNLKLDIKVEAGSTQPIEEGLKQQKIISLLSLLSQFPTTTPETYLVLAEQALEDFQVVNKDKILQTMKVPQGTPRTSVSVALKGDLNQLQVADIAKQAGASDQSTNPELVTNLMVTDRKDKLVDNLIKDQGKFQGKFNGQNAGTTTPAA